MYTYMYVHEVLLTSPCLCVRSSRYLWTTAWWQAPGSPWGPWKCLRSSNMVCWKMDHRKMWFSQPETNSWGICQPAMFDYRTGILTNSTTFSIRNRGLDSALFVGVSIFKHTPVKDVGFNLSTIEIYGVSMLRTFAQAPTYKFPTNFHPA